jgi:hypothetical protein
LISTGIQISMPPMRLVQRLYFIVIISMMIMIDSCTATSGKSFLPAVPGYEEKRKELIVLDDYLLEISGIFYLPDGRVAGHNDEKGVLFIFNFQNGEHETIEFSGKGDYEDVVQYGDFYYIMESDGDLHKVSVASPYTAAKIKFLDVKKTEFESLYIDAAAGRLVLLTKDHRNAAREILAYAFELNSQQFIDQPVYRIPMSDVFSRMHDNTVECKPSGAAVHPIEKKVYVIASVGKAMLVCSLEGKVEHVYKLNPTQFPQPEGITFAPNGDMYISNEGLQGKATILKFPYVKSGSGK